MAKNVPVIPWIGGKRRLAKHLLPLFPDHKCYVELFCGAAALFFARPPADVEVINDINGDVVNLYRVIRYHLEEFHKEFKRALISREMYEWAKITPPETLTDIQKAARFFYLQKMAFGGKVESRTFGTAPSTPPRFNLLRIEDDLSAAHLRLARVYIEHLDWARCVSKYDRDYTFFFADPPYWQTEGYGVEFGWDQYEALAATARGIKGKIMITLNDHPDVRDLFAEFNVTTVDINYTVGGSREHRKAAKELIIRSW
ncbi:MAG: DNA adenine methylase [Gammaproteobacteria bacterium]|nr:DNA adenine methylase [Gammaproteobacteria bacterium]